MSQLERSRDERCHVAIVRFLLPPPAHQSSYASRASGVACPRARSPKSTSSATSRAPRSVPPRAMDAACAHSWAVSRPSAMPGRAPDASEYLNQVPAALPSVGWLSMARNVLDAMRISCRGHVSHRAHMMAWTSTSPCRARSAYRAARCACKGRGGSSN